MSTLNHFNRRGLDLDTPRYWVIDHVEYPILFFKHVSKLLPSGSILYFEGGKISTAAAELYAAHKATNAMEVVQETVMPMPQIFHCTVSDEFLRTLGEMAMTHKAPGLFNHLKAYREAKLLFAWSNAYEGALRISDHVPEESVEHFCQALGVSPCREKATAPKPEPIERVSLTSNDSEDEEEVTSVSWAQRAWTWLKKN